MLTIITAVIGFCFDLVNMIISICPWFSSFEDFLCTRYE